MKSFVIGASGGVELMDVCGGFVLLKFGGIRDEVERFADPAVHVVRSGGSGEKGRLDCCVQILLECIEVFYRVVGLGGRFAEILFEFLDLLV
jgi:hypothetical protein